MSSTEYMSDEEMESISKIQLNGSIDTNRRKSLESIESIESRQTSYLKFMSTLPRLCSPTICGTVNYKTPNRQKWTQMSPLEYKPFEWSIEQKALLDPIDFSVEDIDLFRDFDDRLVSKQLDEENERFFAQKQIIPSPKTPERDYNLNDSKLSHQSIGANIWSPNWSQNKTPDYQTNSRNNISIECFRTPLNCSKSRQKKKLFGDDHYLMESVMSRSPKDSAFETIGSQNLLSPIYSPDWRNTSLSKRITHLSPILSRIHNYVEMDLTSGDNSPTDQSMQTKIDTYSDLNYDMLSIESQRQEQNDSECQLSTQLSHNRDPELSDLLIDYNRCQQNMFQKYLCKTSTPSHL